MTASTKSTTDAAERIVEAALALGPQIRAASTQWNRAAIYRPPLFRPCSGPASFG